MVAEPDRARSVFCAATTVETQIEAASAAGGFMPPSPAPPGTPWTVPLSEVHLRVQGDFPSSAYETHDESPVPIALYVPSLNKPDTPTRASALLQMIATPAGICDHFGTLLEHNHLLEELLSAQDGLFLHTGQLKCVVGIQTTLLHQTIHALITRTDSQSVAPKSVILRISRAESIDPLVVVLSPLKGNETRRTQALIRIVTSSLRRTLDVESLCTIFDLTPSEAALCAALTQCGNLKDAAAMCRITPGSARQYMKRVFTKTNTSSQVDLLSRLLHYPIL